MKARASKGREPGLDMIARRMIPAIPAIRPENSISATAERPSKAPPRNDAKGVNSVVIMISEKLL
jgi:hypothetical protein